MRGNGVPAMEQGWEKARLIPTAGIRGEDEKEQRAASALLAVLPAVPDFAHGLLKRLKAPKGNIRTYTEVRLKDRAGKTQTPDGAIIVERGRTRWCCLVEFKTGRSQLDGSQVERYLDAARENGFDGLLTISNQLVGDPDGLPYSVDKRKVGSLTVRHLSWWAVLTEAVLQSRFRGVDDLEQAFILAELVRYLTDERSGASAFLGMGDGWNGVREGARHRTLRANDPAVREIAARWEQFVRFLCLALSQELGVEVRPQRSRGKDAGKRVDAAAALLANEGTLRGAFRVPDAVGPITVEANLATGQISASVEVEAPRDRQRPTARIRWLLNELTDDAPEDLMIGVQFVNTPGVHSRTLGDCGREPEPLLLPEDPRREPRSFILTESRRMARRAGRGGSVFVADTRRLATDFYRDLVQEIRPPRPRAPRLAEPEEQPTAAVVAETEARKEQRDQLAELGELSDIAPPESGTHG